MNGYPISYGNTLDEVNSFTSGMFIQKISDYWSNDKNRINFSKGYKLGLVVFGIGSLLLTSKSAFASDSGMVPDNNGTATPTNLPESTGSTEITVSTESLAADRGAFGASALGIWGSIAMKSGAYWVGFLCAAAVIVGVRMATVPAKQAL